MRQMSSNFKRINKMPKPKNFIKIKNTMKTRNRFFVLYTYFKEIMQGKA